MAIADTDQSSPIERPLDPNAALRWAGLLREAADVLEQRLTGDLQPGWWQAPARLELAESATQRCPDGSPWGEQPYRLLWTGHAIIVRTLVEHAHAVEVLLQTMPNTPLPIEAQARVLLELAAESSWLTHPGISGRARVARFEVLRRSSAVHHDRLAHHLDLAVADDDPIGVAGIDHYNHDILGLHHDHGRRGGWTGIEGQPSLGPTDQVAAFMTRINRASARATYAMLCGAPHGQLWRLTQGYRPTGSDSGWEPRPFAGFTQIATMVAIESLLLPAIFACRLLGYRAGLAQLHELATRTRRELTT